MECPICYSTFSRNCIQLECKHKFCAKCSIKWIAIEKTCPLCRTPTNYLSRPTRSFYKAQDTISEFKSFLTTYLSIVETFYPEPNPSMELECMISMIQSFILKRKHLWYRPDMQSVIKSIQKEFEPILSNHHLLSQLDPSRIKILRQFQTDFV